MNEDASNKMQNLIVSANALQQKYPQFRYGQALSNALHSIDEKLAEKLTGTDVDPFYKDSRVDIFLCRVAKEWEQKSG